MKDFVVHVYHPIFNTQDQVYVLANGREKARGMVQELYPDWMVQAIFQEDDWFE